MYFEDIKLNQTIELDTVTVNKDDMIDFAEKYDNLPLHTDEEYAKSTTFGGLIAPGVFSFMIVWAKYVEKDICGEQLIAGKSTHIEWLAPVFPNDELTGVAYVSALTVRTEKHGTVELTIDIKNQNGITVIKDITEAVVRRKDTSV